MKKIIRIVSLIAVSILVLSACKSKGEGKEQGDQSFDVEDADFDVPEDLEWAGFYKGTLPCADCSGIIVHLTLYPDTIYSLHYQYLGKDDRNAYTSSGTFTWNESGDRITLDIQGWPPYYVVGENKLIQLDMEGNYITGELADRYVLTKTSGAE